MKKASFILTTIFIINLFLTLLPATAQQTPDDDIQAIRELSETIKSSEDLLQKYPEKDFTPTLMFQLSELYIKRSTLKFQREMMIYEEEERKVNSGVLKKKLVLPKINFDEAINISFRLLEKYPKIFFKDKIYYRIALSYDEQGDKDLAAKYFATLSTITDDATMLDETYFRLGEYYFEKKNYKTTIDYYSRLLHGWDSPFFDMALYKLGWAYYNVSDFSKAISTFIYLIEDINELDKVEYADLGKTKADLRQESIQYVAICFAEQGGAFKAGDFLYKKKDKAYTEKILNHLVEIYQQRNFYDQAIETLNVLIDFYPDRPIAAIYQKRIVENFQLTGDKDQANAERAKLVRQYGPGSAWLNNIVDAKQRKGILDIAEEFLYTLGTDAQVLAQTSKDTTDYNKAIAWYSSYMEKFPDYERAHKVRFYLGECYFEIKDYAHAADAYYDLLLNYPKSEFCKTTAYNRILAYDFLLEANTSKDTTEFFIFNFLGKKPGGVDIIKTVNSSQAQLIQASNDFFIYYSDSPRMNEILMNIAQILYELEQYSLAQEVYSEVIKNSKQNPYLVQAYSMMAQCEFKKDNYTEAEGWYRQLVTLYPDSAKIIQRAKTMIASARFRQAEVYLAARDSLKAAQFFEEIAGQAYDREIAERSLFEAAKQFEALGRKEKAIALYESVYTKFPKSGLVETALFKAGFLSEEMGNWQRAAKNYLALYQHDRFSEHAPKSLFLAARCYENDGKFDLARTYYKEYTDAYIMDADRYLEAAFKSAEIAYNQGMTQSAIKDLNFVINAYQKFVKEKIPVESYFPANAQFLIGELTFESFKKIRLTPPLESRLKNKRAVFQNVLKAYTDAAKFKVAEWTIASSCKIGMTFEEFADALLSAPRPANLSEEDLDKYNEKLWQNILPFKEKAQKTYEANLKNANENNIVNKWVTESEKRLNALNLELGHAPSDLARDKDS